MLPINENLNSCDQIPNEWKCEVKTNSTQNTFAVLIPTFKRNYLIRSIKTLNMKFYSSVKQVNMINMLSQITLK